MKKLNGKKIFGLALASGVAAGYTAICNKLFDTTVDASAKWSYGGKEKSAKARKDGKGAAPVPLEKYGDAPKKAKEWLRSQKYTEVEIHSSVDDTKLNALYFPREGAKRMVLCVHGYRGKAIGDMAGIDKWFLENGCELLLIEQRCCGNSGGKYITFGAREKYDVLDWVDFLEERNRKSMPIYLYGVSMGAATISCAAGLTLPPNVRGLIADCGYTSMLDITSICLKKWYRLPAFPLMQSFDRRCESRAHFRMAEADAEKSLRNCRIPSLFVHGTQDAFVPPSHAVRNYRACGSDQKNLLWVDGAGHATAFYEDPASYTAAVEKLFSTCEGSKES